MSPMRLQALAVVGAAAILAALPAGGAPSPVDATFQTKIQGPRMGTGTFSADLPFCRAGTSREENGRFVGSNEVAFDRELVCGDGSGSITARVQQTILFDPMGTGSWRVESGTGAYKELRGSGTSSLTATGPDTYRETWRGVADLDDVAPSLRIERLRATALQRPKGAYVLRLAFRSQDNQFGNRVGYVVTVTAGPRRATRSGTVASGGFSSTLRLRHGAGVRNARVKVKVTDPVGNSRNETRVVSLPR